MERKWLSSLVILIMLSSLVIGCAKKETAAAAFTQAEPTKLTLFAHNMQDYEGKENDRILKEVEKVNNVSLNLTGAPWEGWTQKLALKVNTGEIPDLFFYLTYRADYANWAANGVPLNLDPYFDKAPHIKQLLETDLYKNLKLNGHYYFVPFVFQGNNHAIYYRKDWLDKLGLKEPANMDEFTAMLHAFTEKDPDGDGKKDTIGMTGSKISAWFNVFEPGFGVKTDWNKNASGVYEPGYLTNGYKQFLSWMNKVYQAGYLQKEYFLNDDAQKEEAFYSGKAGVMITNGSAKVDEVMAKIKQANPNAVVDVLTPPDGPAGKGGMFSFGGWWGGWSISSKTKDPLKAVQLLDYLISPEGQQVIDYGVEGVHYTKNGDKIVPNLDERKKESKGTFGEVDGQPVGLYGIGTYFGSQRKINGTKIKAFGVNDFLKNAALANKADAINNSTVVKGDTTNVLSFPADFAEISKKMGDISDKYSIMIIAGDKTLDAGWDAMNKEINGTGYAKAQQMVKETMDKILK